MVPKRTAKIPVIRASVRAIKTWLSDSIFDLIVFRAGFLCLNKLKTAYQFSYARWGTPSLRHPLSIPFYAEAVCFAYALTA